MKHVVLFCIFSLFLLSGCRTIGGGIVVTSGHHHSQHSPMPPAHAPAHGRRQLHHYQYYPNAEFYFDVNRNMYFYLDSRGQWSFSVNLPIHLRSHLSGGYVEIEMDSDRPYSKHTYYKNKYKKNIKYKQKYKSKKKYSPNKKYKTKEKYSPSKKYKPKEKYSPSKKHKSKEKHSDKKKKSQSKSKSKKGKYKNDDDEKENGHKNNRKY